MKKTDEAVEKVLAGLRGVEAGAGFEERILRRVRGAARERRARRFGVWQWVGVGCVGMVVAGVGLSVLRIEKREVVVTNAGSTGGVGVEAGRDGVGAVEEGVPQRLKPRFVERGSGTAEAVPLSRAGFGAWEGTQRSTQTRGGAKVLLDASSLQAAGAMGGGFPAPPLPLTEQEKLLLRVARHGEPLPVATVEIAAVPSQDAAETAEFQGFFGKPERLEQLSEKVSQGDSK